MQLGVKHAVAVGGQVFPLNEHRMNWCLSTPF